MFAQWSLCETTAIWVAQESSREITRSSAHCLPLLLPIEATLHHLPLSSIRTMSQLGLVERSSNNPVPNGTLWPRTTYPCLKGPSGYFEIKSTASTVSPLLESNHVAPASKEAHSHKMCPSPQKRAHFLDSKRAPSKMSTSPKKRVHPIDGKPHLTPSDTPVTCSLDRTNPSAGVQLFNNL